MGEESGGGGERNRQFYSFTLVTETLFQEATYDSLSETFLLRTWYPTVVGMRKKPIESALTNIDLKRHEGGRLLNKESYLPPFRPAFTQHSVMRMRSSIVREGPSPVVPFTAEARK